jgi:hypothetical protein
MVEPKYKIDQEVKSPVDYDHRQAFIGGIIPFDDGRFFYWLRYVEIEEAMQTIWEEKDIQPVSPVGQGKPCALILNKGKGEDWQCRVLTFDDHIQAMDVAEHFKKAGWGWSMRPFEHVARGQKPGDMPIVQMDLFGKVD